MASIFGAAFDRLDRDVQMGITKKLTHRRSRYLKAMGGASLSCNVVLLADTPGPGRPTMAGYHHTPFYSTKNSSLWLNKLLVEHQVQETDLVWFNTTLADGKPLSPTIFLRQLGNNPLIICLGGNAEKWLTKTVQFTGAYEKVFHPQAWKRFHSKEPYPLMEHLVAHATYK